MFAASQDPTGEEHKWDIPVVLFPGGAHALSPAADAITFMMLMNSNERAFLVGEQVRGAPHLHRFGVEALPTGYVVCAPGDGSVRSGQRNWSSPPMSMSSMRMHCALKCTASRCSIWRQAVVPPPRPPGFDSICSGGGGLTLLVGGGLRTASDVRRAVDAGAKYIVTGTVTEDASSLDELRTRLQTLVGACTT